MKKKRELTVANGKRRETVRIHIPISKASSRDVTKSGEGCLEIMWESPKCIKNQSASDKPHTEVIQHFASTKENIHSMKTNSPMGLISPPRASCNLLSSVKLKYASPSQAICSQSTSFSKRQEESANYNMQARSSDASVNKGKCAEDDWDKDWFFNELVLQSSQKLADDMIAADNQLKCRKKIAAPLTLKNIFQSDPLSQTCFTTCLTQAKKSADDVFNDTLEENDMLAILDLLENQVNPMPNSGSVINRKSPCPHSLLGKDDDNTVMLSPSNASPHDRTINSSTGRTTDPIATYKPTPHAKVIHMKSTDDGLQAADLVYSKRRLQMGPTNPLLTNVLYPDYAKGLFKCSLPRSPRKSLSFDDAKHPPQERPTIFTIVQNKTMYTSTEIENKRKRAMLKLVNQSRVP